MRKKVAILGSTGSVGVNTLAVIREHRELFEVTGLAAGSNAELLRRQIEEFSPRSVFLRDPDAASGLARTLNGRVKLFTEEAGLEAFEDSHDYDILMAASSGTSALDAVLRALGRGRRVALANKEVLVVGGGPVTRAARTPGAEILPVDSEHSAIFQCLQGSPLNGVERLILTGSGGPLREVSSERFAGISKETVVNHPKWRMGRKISVDSATMMNKGLEIIEARWLFGLPIERVDVLIHPEAIVHSMVEFKDGSVIAQLGVTDMKLPIQVALCHPDRLPAPPERRLRLDELGTLTFQRPDRKKFPCLDLAYAAGRAEGSAPCVLSAADEVAVGAFLADRIDFTEIPRVIEKVLSSHRHVPDPQLDEIRLIHDWATEETKRLCQAR